MSTPEKQNLLQKMNSDAQHAHQAAEKAAERAGKPAPAAPAPITMEQVEFPKWLHKGWKATDKAPGHHEAKESKLARNAEELKALEAQGFTDAPGKVETKAVVPDAPAPHFSVPETQHQKSKRE